MTSVRHFRWGWISLLLVACSAPVPALQPTTIPATPVVGSGRISFGTGYDPTTLKVTGAKSTFGVKSKSIAWSAEFTEQAGATELTLVLASKRQGGAEESIHQEAISISNPAFGILANQADLASIVGNRPGTYVLRYLRGAVVLAEGEFTLVR